MGARCAMTIDAGELSMGFAMVVGEVGWYVGWVVVPSPQQNEMHV
jgi:hypothetical protein